jgi:hypothetical protein
MGGGIVMANEFEDLLNEYAAAVVERAKSNLRIKRRVRGKVVNRFASGNLSRSLVYKLKFRYNKPTIDFTVNNDAAGKYADVIEDGRRPYPGQPNKRPPVKAIEEWIKIKKLKLRNNQGQFIKSTDDTIRAAALRIAINIGERGIEGIHYYQDAVNDTWDEYKEQLITAYVKGFEQRYLLNKR